MSFKTCKLSSSERKFLATAVILHPACVTLVYTPWVGSLHPVGGSLLMYGCKVYTRWEIVYSCMGVKFTPGGG